MALRNTSPAVELMKTSGEIALGKVPIKHAEIAYRLGVHHKREAIDPEALPFETVPSPKCGLTMMRDVLEVREVRVIAHHEVGSHTLFVTTAEHRQEIRPGRQMFHVQGLYQDYLERHGRPL